MSAASSARPASTAGRTRAAGAACTAVLPAVALAAAVLVAFSPLWNAGFISLDDTAYVTGNPHVRDGLSLDGAAWALRTTREGNWHPLTWLSHQLDAQVWGLNPHGHHATSVLLHAANAVLVFLLLRRLVFPGSASPGSASAGLAPVPGGAATAGATLAAAFFALHPLRVESVAWVAERKDVLSAFFGLFALRLWVESVVAGSAAGSAEGRGSRAPGRFLAGSIALYAAGLASKPMLVTLPFVMLLLDVWPLRRWRASSAIRRSLWFEKAPFFALAAISCVVTLVAQSRAETVAPLSEIRFGDRLGNAAISVVLYLVRTIWPLNLSVFYPHPGARPLGVVLAAAALVAALTVAALALRRAAPWLAVGWLWFLGMLVPVLGLVQVGEQALADRYTYLPSIGLALAAAAAIAWAAARLRGSPRRTMLVIGFVVVAALGVATARQATFWADDARLFRRAVAVNPGDWVGWFSLGNHHLREGRTAEARECFEKALALRSDLAEAHNALGMLEAEAGRLEAAEARYREALRLRPRYPEALHNLGNALRRLGRIEEATAAYEQALAADPELVESLLNLGLMRLAAGRAADSLTLFDEAVRLSPDLPEARFNRAVTLETLGRPAEAEAEYRAVLAASPEFTPAADALRRLRSREDAGGS